MNQVTRITTEIERLSRSGFVKATAHFRDAAADGTRSLVHRVRVKDGEFREAEFQAIHELSRIVDGWADCRFGRLIADGGLYLTPELGEFASLCQELVGASAEAEEEAVVVYSVPRRRLDPMVNT